MADAMTCASCPFWNKETPISHEGQCRVNPPTRTEAHDDALWPSTDQNDWCGQHPARKPPLYVYNEEAHL